MEAETLALILKANKEAFGRILDVSELCFSPKQFAKFKKIVFGILHDELNPTIKTILKSKYQVRAVPLADNLDGKEVDHDS
jgi:hypothetical protein